MLLLRMATKAPAVAKMSWLLLLLVVLLNMVEEGRSGLVPERKNAYATMLYMGTPRDHDFYIAARVMLRSLARLQVDADLVVIASKDLPKKWVQTLHNEGVKVVSVDDIANPYRFQPDFDRRFLLTLNKLYAWNLVEYERVVMLDADNLFLKNTDELFQCGKFCAVFINPCIFHTGLFVLEPSRETFNTMLNQIGSLKNKDGADQGYLMAYFDDLLERPLFRPQVNGSRLDGTYRLPLGYQMDASYYYLKLRWSVPCGPNSVITFPSMPWLKPWYWWSWPVLPLGLSWHEQRVHTIGYEDEIMVAAIEAVFYMAVVAIAYFVARRAPQHLEKVQPGCKACPGAGLLTEQFVYPFMTRVSAILAVALSFALPFFMVPRTMHPMMGWGLFLLGSFSLLTINIAFFRLPCLAVFTPWLGILGTLLVMAYPFYTNGIVRALSLGAYVFLVSPFLWWAFKQVNASIDTSADRDSARPWAVATRLEPQQSELMKLC